MPKIPLLGSPTEAPPPGQPRPNYTHWCLFWIKVKPTLYPLHKLFNQHCNFIQNMLNHRFSFKFSHKIKTSNRGWLLSRNSLHTCGESLLVHFQSTREIELKFHHQRKLGIPKQRTPRDSLTLGPQNKIFCGGKHYIKGTQTYYDDILNEKLTKIPIFITQERNLDLDLPQDTPWANLGFP